MQDRIGQRVNALPAHLEEGDRAAAVQQIEQEEHDKPTRKAVAGFDYTFSAPKSVSVLWGVADAGRRR